MTHFWWLGRAILSLVLVEVLVKLYVCQVRCKYWIARRSRVYIFKTIVQPAVKIQYGTLIPGGLPGQEGLFQCSDVETRGSTRAKKSASTGVEASLNRTEHK